MAYTLLELENGRLLFIDKEAGKIKEALIKDDAILTQEEMREIIIILSKTNGRQT